MKSATGGVQVELLEALACLAGIVVGIGSAVGGWSVNLLIALIMVVVLYAVFRDVRMLSRLNFLNEQAQSFQTKIPLRKFPP